MTTKLIQETPADIPVLVDFYFTDNYKHINTNLMNFRAKSYIIVIFI